MQEDELHIKMGEDGKEKIKNIFMMIHFLKVEID